MTGSLFADLLVLVVGPAVIVMLVVLTRRLSSADGRGRASGGVGNALAGINEILQPQHPAVEMFQKDVDPERDEDGEPK